ncbi:hypothetical protein [Sulfurospirillum sp. 1612]|uniref:hypothetical protein n=1 Tax=Sulfurospirillum sp. 1612 TaxID=3094835 RepID=UPI002F91D033
MDSWFSCNLGDAMLATERLDAIEKRFLSQYEKQNQPEDMAIFYRHESEGRLQCEVKVYFSPKCASIAQEFDAIKSPRPAPESLGQLAGSPKARTLLWEV